MKADIGLVILKAAEHIRSHPDYFEFIESCVPSAINDLGCALGWIAFFDDEPAETSIYEYCSRRMACQDGEFYRRMAEIQTHWFLRASTTAETLIQYARIYHQKERYDFIPASVRALFKQKEKVIHE